MRITTPIIGGSGVEIYHQRLAAGLSKFGVETRILKFSPRFELFPWALQWKFRKRIPELTLNIIHTHAEYGYFFRQRERPLVVTLHHSSIDHDYLKSLALPLRIHHQLILKPSVKKTVSLADRLVSVSRHTTTVLSDVFQQDLAIQVIYNGIDTQVFRPIECPTSMEPIILFFSGNPSHRKGFDLLGPIMERLGNDFLLRYTTGLRRAVHPTLTGPNIQCLGFLTETELVREINRADIALQPSRHEGFGFSILEAMACGKPVVSTNCSAIPEVLEHERGGYLCEAGSVEQMVTAIRNLGDSPDLRRQMGEHNRKIVLQKFTLDQMSNQYFDLYRSLT